MGRTHARAPNIFFQRQESQERQGNTIQRQDPDRILVFFCLFCLNGITPPRAPLSNTFFKRQESQERQANTIQRQNRHRNQLDPLDQLDQLDELDHIAGDVFALLTDA